MTSTCLVIGVGDARVPRFLPAHRTAPLCARGVWHLTLSFTASVALRACTDNSSCDVNTLPHAQAHARRQLPNSGSDARGFHRRQECQAASVIATVAPPLFVYDVGAFWPNTSENLRPSEARGIAERRNVL
jgi:hypothetical protein